MILNQILKIRLNHHEEMYTQTDIIPQFSDPMNDFKSFKAICEYSSFLVSQNQDNHINLAELIDFASY